MLFPKICLPCYEDNISKPNQLNYGAAFSTKRKAAPKCQVNSNNRSLPNYVSSVSSVSNNERGRIELSVYYIPVPQPLKEVRSTRFNGFNTHWGNFYSVS